MIKTFVIGKAVLKPEGLRCNSPRPKQPEFTCGKLLAKPNHLGQLCGQFKCDRCKQVVEILNRPV